MPSKPAVEEARRVMTFCNACRYCEGFCAVFPAMELRRHFSKQDLNFLANLCHNCRDCYYACQYAPPHEFGLNIPQVMAAYRLETYHDHCWPQRLKGLFRYNPWMVALITLISIIGIIGGLFIFKGNEAVFARYSGNGAFYKLISYETMVVVPSFMVLAAAAGLFMSFKNYWHETGGKPNQLFNLKAHITAIGDVLQLRYLEGGGHGCNYPDETFSMARRWLHHLVFYGFVFCFAATAAAAFYEHFLLVPSPFALFSLPVILGVSGGLLTLIGTGGLLYLKTRMNRVLTTETATKMDITFLIMLLITNLTGLLLLAFRETSALATLLGIHLGCAAGFLITAPYGKLVHATLRYAALVINAAEKGRGRLE